MAFIPAGANRVANPLDKFFAIRSLVFGGGAVNELDLDVCSRSRDETVLVPIGCCPSNVTLGPLTFTTVSATSPFILALTL
jgi:hypothetical protein